MRKVLGGVCMVLLWSSSLVAAETELAGSWKLTIDTPRGVQHPVLDVVQQGDAYSGTYNSRRGPIDIAEIAVAGNQFSFPLVISIPIGTIEVNYVGTIAGDAMQGVAKNPRGEVPFSGERMQSGSK